MSLCVRELSFAYGRNRVLQSINTDVIPRGKLTALLGPNAAGKSTLFKNVAGLLKGSSGQIELDDMSLNRLGKKAQLDQVCYMPQQFSSQAMLNVFDVVLLARKNLNQFRVDDCDLEVVSSLLEQLGISHLATRYISELSGGQQQLVSLCQALVRDAGVYLLDEPTSALDLGRQLQVMEVLKREAQRRNAVVMIAIHDLSLAARYAEHVLLMDQGKLVASGATETVFQSKEIADIYGVAIEVLRDSQNGMVVSATRKE